MSHKTKHVVIATNEMMKKVNKENIKLINGFTKYLVSTQKRNSTIDAYVSDLNITMVWNLQYNENISFVEWTKKTVIDYQDWCIHENNDSPARVHRLKSTLSSFSEYISSMLDDEYPNFTPVVNKVKNPVLSPVRDKTVYTEKEIKHLLNVLTEEGKYDEACAVALAAYSGRRKSELLRFRIDDFDKSHKTKGGKLYKSHPIETKGSGKNGKLIPCYCLVKEFKPYYKRWMKYRKKHGIESEWLFPDKKHPENAMKKHVLDGWTKRYTEITGKNFYWHSLRHLTVTSFKKAGFPNEVIQKYIGWSNINMVDVYNDMDDDEILDKHFGKSILNIFHK